MKRPSRSDTYVQEMAGRLMLDRIRKYDPSLLDDCGDDGDIARELAKAMRYAGDDGYDIAKALEDEGWEMSAQMVDVLDGGTFTEAIEHLTEQWIAAGNIQPKLALGTKGIVRAWDEKNPKGADAEGEITKIDTKAGAYTVTCAGQKPGYGYIHKWEDLEAKWSLANETPKDLASKS